MTETRLPHILAWLLLAILVLSEPGVALSSSFGSAGSGGSVSSTCRYSLDSSSSLQMESSFGDGFLSQRGQSWGAGQNSIQQSLSGDKASVQSKVVSSGSFSAQTSAQVSGAGASLSQQVSGSGQVGAAVQGQSCQFAAQSAAVAGGDLQTAQAVSAGGGVQASQDTDISGQTGRVSSQMLSADDQMKVWGRFQGQGRLEADLIAGSAIGSSVDGQVSVDGMEWMDQEALSRIAGSNQGLAVQGLRVVGGGVGTFGVAAESRDRASQVATLAEGGFASSYAFTEPKWRWNTRDPKIQLYLRTDSLLTGEGLTAAQAQAAITAASNTWDDAVGQNLFADGTTVIPSSTVRADYPYDGVNVHAWKKLTNAPGALAYSRTRYDVPVVDGYYSVLESDVSYNTDVIWSTNLAEGTTRAAGQPFDVQTVALHELGHTIGLGDLYTLPSTDPRYLDWGQIMNSYDDVQRTLGSGDRTGATGLYGISGSGIGIYRAGTWFLNYDKCGLIYDSKYFGGILGDLPKTADWDGDGQAGIGVYRNGWWYLNNNRDGSTYYGRYFGGLPGDIPVTADWDGINGFGLGVYRAGTWYLNDNADGQNYYHTYFGGLPGDIPVTADWDGDGQAGIGVYRNGWWYLNNNRDGATYYGRYFGGLPGDIPVTADWDGDGMAEIGVYRDGWWHLSSNENGISYEPVFFGGFSGDIPVTGYWVI